MNVSYDYDYEFLGSLLVALESLMIRFFLQHAFMPCLNLVFDYNTLCDFESCNLISYDAQSSIYVRVIDFPSILVFLLVTNRSGLFFCLVEFV